MLHIFLCVAWYPNLYAHVTRFVDKALELEEVATNEQSSRHEFRRAQPYTGCLRSCYSAKIGTYVLCIFSTY